jgi:hypothetical protein
MPEQLQLPREFAHCREDAENFLRMMPRVIGLLANLHQHVDDIGPYRGIPTVQRVELIAENQAQCRHAGSVRR